MRYLRISFLLLMMSAACLLTGCAHKNKTDEMSSKERKALAEYKVKSYQEGKTKYAFRVQGKSFQKYDGKQFQDYYITGVNIGSSEPNSFPGELAVSEDEYLKWFEEIAELHVNSIRVYTVLMPAFYNAFYRYNLMHEDKLFLIQGCWYDEETIYEKGDAFTDIDNVKMDLKDLVDIIHGNGHVAKRTGHAYGDYTKGISDYVMGWILGIESDQVLVEGTRDAHLKLTSYQGEYLSCKDVKEPYEVFWCEIGDYVLKYEDEQYQVQRPVSYSNWATADVMKHPNEPLEREDAISLTVDDLDAGAKFKAGIFASYHVYSYYPNFMFKEEPYCSYKDDTGKINTYLAYLKDLVAHHNCPVLIAEFGIPASRGVTHINPLTGFNQGAVNDETQGKMLISMFEDIKKAGCAGGMIFVWEDEWFKRTWNTMDYTNSDFRAYWNDVQTSEQHFGLLEYISDECEQKPILDGKLDDWASDEPVLQKGSTTVYAKCDSTYLYLAVKDPNADFDKAGQTLYFDINPDVGCGNYGKTKLSSKADFALAVNGKNNTRLLADAGSDPYVRATPDWKSLDLKQDALDTFHRIYMITDRKLRYPQTGEVTSIQKVETGLLKFGKVDVDRDIGDVLTDFYYSDSVFEVRIPWGLLGFSAPSIKEINDLDHGTTCRVEGINIGYISNGKNKGQSFFTWDDWDHAKYKERLRKSYYILQDYLAK